MQCCGDICANADKCKNKLANEMNKERAEFIIIYIILLIYTLQT